MTDESTRHEEAYRTLCSRLNLILAFDHVGRAGNGFLLGIFDRHPEVMGCHWVHYLYSYLVTEFGMESRLDSARACKFILEKSYFRYVFQDADETVRAYVRKIGGNPDTPVDRPLCRAVFRKLVLARSEIARRDLLIAAYYAMAVGTGRDVSRTRYLLIADAISLRFEHVMQGFSGRILDAALADFPDLKPISLVRDPRAMYASNRHQYVNQLGNMYGVTPKNALARLRSLLTDDLTMDSSVWSFWLAYGAQTARCIYRLRHRTDVDFRVLRNEDLNLRFVPTMERVAAWLDIDMLPEWKDAEYVPTSMGSPWKGTGAYNSRYQGKTNGPLVNDPQKVADHAAGPNRHVTDRWRSRLAPHEIRLLDLLFAEEMRELGYSPAPVPDYSLVECLIRPFRGELPTFSWIARGFAESPGEGMRRLGYPFLLPPFFVISRMRLHRLYRKGFFAGVTQGEADSPTTPFLSPECRGEQ
ncbi:hypothetical protein [Pseudodesulfovibrio tunisiensis]|uniref:hypothetical protein n=1 Tax=Pseudodesulfovibrio tunisiensis TaxID=463192 RepID=UPI001FB42A10|nr:hypothetical protein [Pseudodesulfovibrio tunisiensis]